MIVAHGDFETSSRADLNKVGAYKYVEDPTTRIWMLSWRLGSGPVQRWHPGDAAPRELLVHVAAGGRFVAHNAGFERQIWNVTLLSLPGCRDWPRLDVAQQDCTMARSLAVHLPAKLERLGPALGLAERKDDEGSRLMKKMAKPRKVYAPGDLTDAVLNEVTAAPEEWTFDPNGGAIRWWNAPDNIARLGTYCDQDVETETEVDARVPPLSDDERELWIRDQRVNDGGVAIDVATVARLADVKREAIRGADARMGELTNGAVRKHTEVAKIVAWLNDRGVSCSSLGKDRHDELRATAEVLGDDEAKKVVDLRAQATKTSTAKLDAMLDTVCADNRARGLFSYHRALTGRFGGAKIQPQNLPRVDEDTELPQVVRALEIVEQMRDASAAELHAALEEACDLPVMTLLSKMLRSMFVAPEGSFLVGADFSGIEARINAWMADETKVLDAIRAFDAGAGPDAYKLSYSETFGIPVAEVTKFQRQSVGKPQILACGYQGSVGAILRIIKSLPGVTAQSITNVVLQAVGKNSDKWTKAAEQHDRLVYRNGLPRDQWIALKVVVNGWRDNNPRIAQSWWDRQDAIIEAVESPGSLVDVMGGKVRYLVADGFLWARLPSGKLLAYAAPRLVERKDDWLVDDEGNAESASEMVADEIAMRVAAGATFQEGKRRLQVCYEGTSQKTGRPGRQYLYGGVLCNNDVQGTARELLRFSMKNVEAAGFGVQVLHVHDEGVNEIAAHMAEGAEARYAEAVGVVPAWLAGLPLAASAWISRRYIK